MYYSDRFVEAFMEKFGMFGILSIVVYTLIVLLIGTLIGAAMNAKFNENNNRQKPVEEKQNPSNSS